MTGSILFAFLSVEIAVRLLGIGPEFHVIYRENFQLSDNSVIGYELVPGSPDDEFTINSAGIRGREITVNKPDGVFRIAIIGDSISFGHRVRRDQTYAARLETLLNRKAAPGSVRYEVLNFGVHGYNVVQVVETLRVRVVAFDPDLVIYGYVLNDPQSFSLEGDSLKQMQLKAEESLNQRFLHGISRFLRHSQVFLLLRRLTLRPPIEPTLFAFDPTYRAHREGWALAFLRSLHQQPETWRRVTVAMASLAGIMNSRSFLPIVVAIFPVDSRDEPGRYRLQDVHARIGAEAERNGLYRLDLADVFQQESKRRLFGDFLHPNSRGHEVVALALLEWLNGSQLLPETALDLEASH